MFFDNDGCPLIRRATQQNALNKIKIGGLSKGKTESQAAVKSGSEVRNQLNPA
jgi:hypothetical protein